VECLLQTHLGVVEVDLIVLEEVVEQMENLEVMDLKRQDRTTVVLVEVEVPIALVVMQP